MITAYLNQWWVRWPEESLPPGVAEAVTAPGGVLYVYRYADGSTSVFSEESGHMAGFGRNVSDRAVAECLVTLSTNTDRLT